MKTKQSVMLGFTFAMVTATFWGSVPIAVKQVLANMDAYTLVWYRFVMSSIGLGLILFYKKKIPNLRLFKQPKWLILILFAALGLAGNFVLFSSALKHLSPTTTQVIAQLSSVGLMIASVVLLKERLRVTQLIGMFVLILGLLLFFNISLIEIFTRFTDYTLGVLLGVIASLVWVVYALAQKILLRRLKAQQILWLLYILCTLIVWPMAQPSQLFQLTTIQLFCLLYCGVNTVIAYGALAEAMDRWEVAKVSAIVTLAPLFTLIFSDILALLWPELFIFPNLNLVGYLGAFIVVFGAVVVAVGHHFWQPRGKQPIK